MLFADVNLYSLLNKDNTPLFSLMLSNFQFSMTNHEQNFTTLTFTTCLTLVSVGISQFCLWNTNDSEKVDARCVI
jgi:hypothetical protein